MIIFDHDDIAFDGPGIYRTVTYESPRATAQCLALQYFLKSGGTAQWLLEWNSDIKLLTVVLVLKKDGRSKSVRGTGNVHHIIEEDSVASTLRVTAGVDDAKVIQIIKILEGRDPMTYIRDFIAVCLPGINPLPWLRRAYPGEWEYKRGATHDCITWDGVVVWSDKKV